MIAVQNENDARREVRLKAERSKRAAAKLAVYLAGRQRKLADSAVMDIREQTETFQNGSGI